MYLEYFIAGSGTAMKHCKIMRQPLKLLIVEDSADDLYIIARELERGGFDLTYERVETAAAFNAALAERSWDLVISDYNLPSFSATEALRLLQETKIDLPFLIVSGAIGEEVAVASMKTGAHDYILKNSLARLVPAVERELREARMRRERRMAQEAFTNLAAIVESSGDAIVSKTLDGTITSWNLGAERIFGYEADEMIGKSINLLIPAERSDEEMDFVERLKRGEIIEHFETVRLRKDGRRVDVAVTISPVRDKIGTVIGASKIARDITERRRTEAALAALSKLGQNLASAGTPIEAARVIGNAAQELFGWDAFTLDLYMAQEEQVQTVLNIDTIEGEKEDVACSTAWRAPSGMARRVIQSGAELILREPPMGMLPETEAFGDTFRPSASVMYVAIRNRTRVIGLMSIHSYHLNAFDQVSLRTLRTLRDYCGGALERIHAREELKASQEQLRALAAHLQSVREEERKLMTREIHDELGQALTGFKMDLVWIRNRLQAEEATASRPDILEKIAKMGTLLDATANLMRKLCTELRPGVLDDLGLVAAIEWQAREYQSRTGIICEAKLELGDLEVDPDRSTALFRIFQEILTNVARHAKATRVDAIMRQVGADLIMEVKDNGRGITKNEMGGRKSLGLLGMRERAVILGGEVEIRGSAGKGTTIKVRMPLPPVKSAPAPAEADEPVVMENSVSQTSSARENYKLKRKVTQ